jgi:ubiquinone/menaquinone biosynthesis C-methylase UbiE
VGLDRVNYDAHQHAVYAEGRALSAQAAQLWRDTFIRWADARRPLTVLDVGSGTGRFTPMLADTFGGPVYGVEPSTRMRQVAEESAGHADVRYLAGSAEHLPLPDGTCDLVLLFLVLQHVGDRPAAAREVRRVLRPGGRVLIRSTFADRPPDLLWHRYFPRARVIEQQLFPSYPETVELFSAAGLRVVALDRVREQMAPGLAAYARRLELRAISIFEYLTEDEIQRGFAELRAAVAAGRMPGPVESDCDLLVLGA